MIIGKQKNQIDRNQNKKRIKHIHKHFKHPVQDSIRVKTIKKGWKKSTKDKKKLKKREKDSREKKIN